MPPIAPPQMRQAMKSVCVGGGKNKPIIMEVIGENGQKIGEHAEGGRKKKQPYYELREAHTI